jgi:hypothetical protein
MTSLNLVSLSDNWKSPISCLEPVFGSKRFSKDNDEKTGADPERCCGDLRCHLFIGLQDEVPITRGLTLHHRYLRCAS